MDKDRDQRNARNAFLFLATLVGAWIVWDSAVYRLITYSMWADYWEHTATLTEWMRNLMQPGNPHLADGSSSARYTPQFFILAVIGQQLGLNAIDLMAISAVVNYLLTVLGIYLFSQIYFRNPWAPVIAFLVLFCAWGVPWIWSNLYELRSFFMVASYPSTFVFGLSLISFWLTLKLLRSQIGILAGMFGLILLAAMAFICHALTGVFAIVGCGLLALTDRDAPLGQRIFVILAVAVGALIADLWPWFSVWDVILAKSDVVDDRTWQSFKGLDGMLARARSGQWQHMFFDPAQFTVSLGPALLGAPIALWLLLKRHYLFIPLGAAVMAFPLVANVFYQIALAHRFLLYAVFFFHLAIIWAVVALLNEWQSARHESTPTPAPLRLTVLVTCALFLFAGVGHVLLLASDYRGVHLKNDLQWVDKRAALPPGQTAVDLYTALTADLPESAVVIGNARLTWPLPTFRGKAVSLPDNHENSLVPDQFERVAAEKVFLAPETPFADRDAIVRKYGATHVIINDRTTVPQLKEWLQSRSMPLTTVERYQIWALNPDPA